jgi:hypothetical protein
MAASNEGICGGESLNRSCVAPAFHESMLPKGAAPNRFSTAC